MWLCIEKIKWKGKIRNEGVLQRRWEERSLMKMFEKKNKSFVGHILEGGGMPPATYYRGRRWREKMQVEMLSDIKEGKS